MPPVLSEPPDALSAEERFNELFSSPPPDSTPTPPLQPRRSIPTRPPLEIRILGGDEPFTAANLHSLYNRLASFPYFLDDFARNPFIFEGGVIPPSLAILWGRPAAGFLWLHSTTTHPDTGESVGYVAIATWARSAWGRTDEIRSLLRATMRGRNLHRVTALICSENRPAKKLALRLGFVEEGCSRRALCYNGVWKDVSVFGLLREDLLAD